MTVLDDPARLGAFVGDVLSDVPDPELDAIVAEATQATGFPVALVTLVLRHVQLFRAQVGLPEDLAISRATDRCSSFCQFVVASGDAFEVTSAVDDARVPQALVERYGIRAYLGLPLTVDGVTLGSLCVIDVKDNRVTSEARATLVLLAERASRRLGELQRQRVAARALTDAVSPVFGELRNQLLPLFAAPEALRLAAAELSPLLRLVRASAAGQLATEDFARASAVLAEAERASEDVGRTATHVEHASSELASSLDGLEHTLTAVQGSVALPDVIAAATRTAHHATKRVGGVHFTSFPSNLRLRALGASPAFVLALALQRLCAARAGELRSGIAARVSPSERAVAVELTAGLDDAAAHKLASELNALVEGIAAFAVGGVLLRWSRA